MKINVHKNVKDARNKKYGSLFMEAHGVHKEIWQGSFNFSDQHNISLNLGSFGVRGLCCTNYPLKEEEEGTEGSQRWFD
jgi:hypothetical protein